MVSLAVRYAAMTLVRTHDFTHTRVTFSAPRMALFGCHSFACGEGFRGCPAVLELGIEVQGTRRQASSGGGLPAIMARPESSPPVV